MRISLAPGEAPTSSDDAYPGSDAAVYFTVMGEWIGRLGLHRADIGQF